MPASRSELDRNLELLNISEGSTWDDVQKGYRQLVQQWHPDRHQGAHKDDAHAKFIEITTAFKILREHHLTTGSVPRHSSTESESAAIFTSDISKSSRLQVTWFQLAFISLTVVIVVVATFWSLDSRQIEQNRDRAHTVSINATQ